VNAVVLVGLILAGLIYTDTLNLKQIQNTFLIAPPPPPQPESIPRIRHRRDKYICKEQWSSTRLSTNLGSVVKAKIVSGPTPADRVSVGSSQKMEV
jgi:hypothetical protein